jgi:hypothetical protein
MQTFENMKQQIGNDLSTIRPPLSNLEAPLSPKSVERTGNALPTTGTWRYGLDLAPPSEVRIERQRTSCLCPPPEERQSKTNDLPTSGSPSTVKIPSFSDILTQGRQTSDRSDWTLINHITSDNQLPTISPDPTLWGTIEHADPSIRRNSWKETRKFTEKAPDSHMPFNAGVPAPYELTGSGTIVRYHRILNKWLNPFLAQQWLELLVRLPPTYKCIDVNLL